MKITNEIALRDFEPWGGACCRFDQFTADELDALEDILNEIYPDGIDETLLNDLFWFDFAYLCDLIGVTCDADTDEVVR